jgi:sugar phosphate isomerase/epimerase
MDLALCHYSYHRRWTAEQWDVDRLAQETAALGLPAFDLHTRLGAAWLDQPQAICAACERHQVGLAGLSISNNFLHGDSQSFTTEVERVRGLIETAAKLGVHTARIFGGHLPAAQQSDARARRSGLQQIIDGIGKVIDTATNHDVTLALENHGCLPGTSAEVLQVLGAIDSPYLRATIDLGNFLQSGEEGHHGAAVLAPYGSYVHVKGMRKVADPTRPWGYRVEACTPGEGDVDLVACFQALRRFGFTGVVAIEYEGPDDEAIGVPASLRAIHSAITVSQSAATAKA